MTYARLLKNYFSFNKLFFKLVALGDESEFTAIPAIKSGFGVESCIVSFNPPRESNLLFYTQQYFNKHTCYIYIKFQTLL